MPKKKQEMSQVFGQSTNEFIFGEKGGRGKNLLLFLKNLTLTGPLRAKPDNDSSESIRQINSTIYGNMAYGYESPDRGGSVVTAIPAERLLTDSQKGIHKLPKRAVSSASALNVSTSLTKTTTTSGPLLPSPKIRPLSRAASASIDSHRPAFRRPQYADLDDDWAADFSDMNDQRGASRESRASPPKQRHVSASGLIDSLHPDLMFLASLLAENTEQSSTDLANTLNDRVKSELQPLLAVSRIHARISKFRRLLCEDEQAVNILELRKLSWNGIPPALRALTWQLLLGYLPTNKTRQLSILKRKRQEYLEGMAKFSLQFDSGNEATLSSPQVPDSSNRDNSVNKEKQLFHQIDIDVKRTNQTLKLYAYPATQKSLKKILFLWAIRHPASGYVQGINDICTPFYQIFLGNYLWQLQRKYAHEYEGAEDESALFIPGLLDELGTDTHELAILSDPDLQRLAWDNFDPGRLSPRVTHILEADSYWCISRLLDNITDNYIHEQPGIIKQVNDLQSLISKIDAPLVHHLEREGVEFIQFSFRWMNCLLMRELSIDLVIRMWDTYLSEAPLGFSGFHIYACAAFLIKFSSDIKEKDFQDILLFLQNPPTAHWTEQDIELMLSEAFIWQSLYKSAGARLR